MPGKSVVVPYPACGHGIPVERPSDLREEIGRAEAGQPCPRCRAALPERLPAPPPRKPRADRGRKRGPQANPKPRAGGVEIMLTLHPDNLAWAREQVAAGRYPSVSAYVDALIVKERVERLIV